MKYGLNHESTARSAYVSHQQVARHTGVRCDPVGFVVDSHDPWLGASPDGFLGSLIQVAPNDMVC